MHSNSGAVRHKSVYGLLLLGDSVLAALLKLHKPPFQILYPCPKPLKNYISCVLIHAPTPLNHEARNPKAKALVEEAFARGPIMSGRLRQCVDAVEPGAQVGDRESNWFLVFEGLKS